MAGEQNVLSDDSLISRLDHCLLRLEVGLALLSGITVFTLMLMAVVSVGGRNFLQTPLAGYVDWIEQAMPLIAFMGIAFVQRIGGHIRMDMLVGKISGRSFYTLEFITTLLTLLLIALLTWGSFEHFLRSIDLSAPLWSRDSSIDIALPLWPAKLLVPVAFAALGLRLVLQLAAYLRAFCYPYRQPVAVPLVIDAATQARLEAEALQKPDRPTDATD